MPSKDPDYSRKWREKRKTGQAYIYAILEPQTRKIRYVGSTKDVQTRISLHWRQREQRTTLLAAWLRTLSAPPEFEILQSVSYADQWAAEEYWTKLLRQIPVIDLLNINDGTQHYGDGTRGRKVSPEKRAEMSVAAKKAWKTSPILRAKSEAANQRRQEPRKIRRIFTPEEITAIIADSRSTRQIARDYGVSHTTIANIKSARHK
jgi:hypothetical protein